MRQLASHLGIPSRPMNLRSSILVGQVAAAVLSFVVATRESAAGRADLPLRIKVLSGERQRHDCAVSLELPDQVALPQELLLVELRDDLATAVFHQLQRSHVTRLWWYLSGVMPAGKERIFELRAAPPDAEQYEHEFVVVEQQKELLQVRHVPTAARLKIPLWRPGNSRCPWVDGGQVSVFDLGREDARGWQRDSRSVV